MCHLRRAGAVPTISNKSNENALSIVEFNPNIDFKFQGQVGGKVYYQWVQAGLLYGYVIYRYSVQCTVPMVQFR
jgi:hypothetical protein